MKSLSPGQTATPRPWQVSGVRQKVNVSGVHSDSHAIGPDSDPVALVFYSGRTPELHAETFGNAKFIVRCVNAHDDLVKALKIARERVLYLGIVAGGPHMRSNDADFLPVIDAAVALAQEKK